MEKKKAPNKPIGMGFIYSLVGVSALAGAGLFWGYHNFFAEEHTHDTEIPHMHDDTTTNATDTHSHDADISVDEQAPHEDSEHVHDEQPAQEDVHVHDEQPASEPITTSAPVLASVVVDAPPETAPVTVPLQPGSITPDPGS